MPNTSQKPAAMPKLFLIDAYALAYRSHFAFISNPLTSSRGEPTSAIFGFVRALLQLLDAEQPSHLAVVFDTPQPTFRHQVYPQYKATRQKMPPELNGQLVKIRDFCTALGAPMVEAPGYEADDVIGTLALHAAALGMQVYLFSGDKDLTQLVNDRIFVYNTGKNGEAQILDAAGVKEKFGVLPQQITDYLALLGDTSDNVPGVPKVGAKTAVELLSQFDGLEQLLIHSGQVKRAALRENLQNYAEQARLSKKLVTLDTAVPLSISPQDLSLRAIDNQRAAALSREFEFNTLLSRFTDSAQVVPADYQLLDTPEKVAALAKDLSKLSAFAFDTETTSATPLCAELVGMSFSWEEGKGYYIPVAAPENPPAPPQAHDLSDFFLAGHVPGVSLKKIFQPLLENARIKKCGQNAKYDQLVLRRYGVEIRGADFDTMVASYVLNPGNRQHNLDLLCLEHFNYAKIPTSSLIGSGKKQKSMRDVPAAEVGRYASEDADFTWRLYRLFEPRLQKGGLYELFEKIEMPLVTVLRDMEWEGITLDLPYLQNMSTELEAALRQLVTDIYALAGKEFNLNSPQQLGRILFEKLKLPRKRRTKTGYSTDADVLEELANFHGLPKKLLEYRELSKLKSTYVDALPTMVNPYTGRLHTSFNQTVAATGRLSSSDPNLQNIPIRTEIGRRIRRAFIPRHEGWKLFDADYSQIELRIVAHLSQDANLIAAFRRDEDIHTATASRVFNVPVEEMTPDIRRRAKEINFGILYGMNAYGLGKRLNISVEEAHNFIANYFIQFPGVNQLMAGTIADAHQKGYVTTMFNRRRFLPDINNANPRVREAAERTAINTPIQGTAADMIKIAMINIHQRLQKEKLQARMLLQVHDELVFETPEHELMNLEKIVREEMGGAVRLEVPVKIEAGVGDNWLEAH